MVNWIIIYVIFKALLKLNSLIDCILVQYIPKTATLDQSLDYFTVLILL